MFDLLKKKIASFADKVRGKLESKAEEKAEEKKLAVPEPAPEAIEEKPPVEKVEEKIIEEKPVEVEEPVVEETKEEIVEEPEIKEEVSEPAEEKFEPVEPEVEEAKPAPEPEEPEIVEEEEIKAEEKPIEAEPEAVEEIVEEKPAEIIEEKEITPPEAKPPKIKEEARELKAKVSVGKKLKGFLVGSVTIEEKDLEGFLFDFELALLEADVEQDTAKEIVEEIKNDLVGKKISKGKDVSEFLKAEIRTVLARMMGAHEIDFLAEVKSKTPYIIMMLGPNGHGKTTSIAKLAHLMQGKGLTVILASSDTFRAGSIEQLAKHADKLGCKVVKHKYGADPAAVAFDAVSAAKAQKADVVLIDTAGRLETDKNLMGELEKIARVVKPDLKIYVGEALAGKAMLEQAMKFDEVLNLNGFILTKIDCDVKGGTSISLLYKIKKPIYFLGTGQGYEDLVPFKPEFILDRVFS